VKRKGSAAIILILVVVAGGLYAVGQNPEIVNQLQENLDISLVGGTCAEAKQWAADNEYSPESCFCTHSGETPDIGETSFAVLELENGQYVGALKTNGTWSNAGTGPGEATETELERTCEIMNQTYASSE